MIVFRKLIVNVQGFIQTREAMDRPFCGNTAGQWFEWLWRNHRIRLRQYLSEATISYIDVIKSKYEKATPKTRTHMNRLGLDETALVIRRTYEIMTDSERGTIQYAKSLKFKEDFEAVAAGLRDP